MLDLCLTIKTIAMKRITFRKKMSIIFLSLLCATTCFSQTKAAPSHWNFDEQETKAFADFLKQPSTEQGKCNAEVLGIVTDISQNPEFSWDDMNTLKNSEGSIYVSTMKQSGDYIYTIWGGGFSGNLTYKGKLHYLYLSAHDKPNESPSVDKLAKLAGRFIFPPTMADVIQISETSIEYVKSSMIGANSTQKQFFNVRRNPKLKQIDISGTNGRLQEVAVYANALEGKDGLIYRPITIPDNADIHFLYSGVLADGKTPNCGVSNVDNNKFTFSTLPTRDDGSVFVGHALQYTQPNDNGTTGLPIGTFIDGKYYLEVDEDVDLSNEYDISGGNLTIYSWKDLNNEGEELSDVTTTDGFFSFDESFEGKKICCEMINPFASKLRLKTVPVTIVPKGFTTGLATQNSSVIKVYPSIVKDYVNIKGENIVSIKVLSTSGACILTETNAPSLNLTNLLSGIYALRIMTTDAGIITKRIIKE